MTPAQYNEYQRQADVIDEAKKWKEKEKLTAVEWLIKIYLQTKKIDSFDIEQAKEMEKQQMHKCASFWRAKENEIEIPIFEEYYNDKYISNVSNVSDVTSCQTEILDEEIEKAAKIFWPQAKESSLIRCWILGAKWYREQLNKK